MGTFISFQNPWKLIPTTFTPNFSFFYYSWESLESKSASLNIWQLIMRKRRWICPLADCTNSIVWEKHSSFRNYLAISILNSDNTRSCLVPETFWPQMPTFWLLSSSCRKLADVLPQNSNCVSVHLPIYPKTQGATHHRYLRWPLISQFWLLSLALPMLATSAPIAIR